jgi:hypothetical protein
MLNLQYNQQIRMIYKEFQPDKGLTDFVKNYWWFDNSRSHQLDFTILPDGCFDLIVSFENYQQKEISLTGLWTKQVDVSIESNTQLFGIRFKLLAVDYILQQPISLFCDSEQKQENNFWQIDKLSFENLESVTEKCFQFWLVKKILIVENKIYLIYYTKQTEKKPLKSIHNRHFGQVGKLIVILMIGMVFL